MLSAVNTRIISISAMACCCTSCWDVSQDRVIIDAPDGGEAAFGPVADYLDHRCGTLDCHGQIGRDLRIWGCDGMRLAVQSVPDCTLEPTSVDEHYATFQSLVALEPEIMNQVVRGHGAHPELLTFIRKARGTETHKGGQLITPGDAQDTCLVSWLADDTDVAACRTALNFPRFPSIDGGPPDDSGP